MKAKDVMSQAVVSITADANVLEAASLMLQHHISGLPVMDKDKLVGVLSEGDFLRRGELHTQRRRSRWLQFIMGPGRTAADYIHTHGSKVSDVMSKNVKTVDENVALEDIVALMERHQIKRVPVMHQGKLVGIVTRSDLVHALVSLSRMTPTVTTDSTIREHILAELKEEEWAPTATASIVVHDGIVDLWGVIMDERQRQAFKVAVENVPGVKAVKDHLVWIGPTSGVIVEPQETAAEPH